MKTKEMEEPVGLFHNENNRLKMEAESLLKVTELLSVTLTATHKHL